MISTTMLRFVVFLTIYIIIDGKVIKFDECCKNPATTSRNVFSDVSKNSPYYVIAVPRTPKTELIDNICYTFFENENGDLLNAISVVYKNGASDQYFFNVVEYKDKDGVSCSRGPDCSFLDYAIHDLCCGGILVLYRCFVSLEKCTDFDLDIGIIPGMDVRLAMANRPMQYCDCLECLLNTMSCDDRFCGNDFILLPNLLCPKCVTEYNCNDAFRYDCAKGEICINDCCRLTPHIADIPAPFFIPPPQPVPLPLGTTAAFPPALEPDIFDPIVSRPYRNPLHYFFG